MFYRTAKLVTFFFLLLLLTNLISNSDSNGKIILRIEEKEAGKDGQIRTHTVDSDGVYEIIAGGARGGKVFDVDDKERNIGGFGAVVKAVVLLKKGDELKIVVGKKSKDSKVGMPGGGGGSFVYFTSGKLLVAAGGGGGTCFDRTPQNASTTTEGGKSLGECSGCPNKDPTAEGGKDGNWGNYPDIVCDPCVASGGPGAGFKGDIPNIPKGFKIGLTGKPGKGIKGNFIGGEGGQDVYKGGNGGFGGGGGGSGADKRMAIGGGGGGGGYSGGGTGLGVYSCGGGGGSYCTSSAISCSIKISTQNNGMFLLTYEGKLTTQSMTTKSAGNETTTRNSAGVLELPKWVFIVMALVNSFFIYAAY